MRIKRKIIAAAITTSVLVGGLVITGAGPAMADCTYSSGKSSTTTWANVHGVTDSCYAVQARIGRLNPSTGVVSYVYGVSGASSDAFSTSGYEYNHHVRRQALFGDWSSYVAI